MLVHVGEVFERYAILLVDPEPPVWARSPTIPRKPLPSSGAHLPRYGRLAEFLGCLRYVSSTISKLYTWATMWEVLSAAHLQKIRLGMCFSCAIRNIHTNTDMNNEAGFQ